MYIEIFKILTKQRTILNICTVVPSMCKPSV